MYIDNNVHTKRYTQNKHSKSLVYNNMGWLGDGSHRGQVRQAWTTVGLPLRYPPPHICETAKSQEHDKTLNFGS